MKDLTVLAIGGNAINADSYKKEEENILETLNGIELIINSGPLVITHGNGPQAGRLLGKLKLPLWLCTAQTQGEIGILLQLSLKKYLKNKKIDKPIINLMTTAVIPENGEMKPIKPAGTRLVPSPKPINVDGIEAIKILLEQGHIVIAGGGGGIPIQKTPTGPEPIEAVIDKDYTSSIIASRLGAKTLIFLTKVENVMYNFGAKNQTPLYKSRAETIKHIMGKSEFKTGMRTKIDASILFLENGGAEVKIGHILKLPEIIAGNSGTIITK